MKVARSAVGAGAQKGYRTSGLTRHQEGGSAERPKWGRAAENGRGALCAVGDK
jgi:hypothetical protein